MLNVLFLACIALQISALFTSDYKIKTYLWIASALLAIPVCFISTFKILWFIVVVLCLLNAQLSYLRIKKNK
jgi:hypothetical protein